MISSNGKRSVVIKGHPTTVSLEQEFWSELRRIALARNVTVSALVAGIDASRKEGNLSSALRLYVLNSYLPPYLKQKRRPGGKSRDIVTGQPSTSMIDPAAAARAKSARFRKWPRRVSKSTISF
jgi:predicted DNA-binding ribbon-helix-helix protein